MCRQHESVRRQAREAVRNAPDVPGASLVDYLDECADAVSDVWEPLLREIWGMADGSISMDRHRLIEIKMALAHDPKED